MAHLVRSDIPFQYALADAFTICDAYHCSLFGPTDPNRYYRWTGWVGNDGSGGRPVVDNAEAGTMVDLSRAFAKGGSSCKIYQDIGLGLTPAGEWGFTADAYIGNYGDNSLLYFHPVPENNEDHFRDKLHYAENTLVGLPYHLRAAFSKIYAVA